MTLPDSSVILDNARQSLLEDLGGALAPERDLSAQLIPETQQAKARIITREPMILAGQAWANAVFELLGGEVKLQWQAKDGQSLTVGQSLCELQGPARSLLTGERSALNWLQSLSGTATLVARYVELLSQTRCRLLDTRKTLPGMRLAQKYAVTCGGGHNHRIGLFDAFLIKENHIAAAGSIANAVQQARQLAPQAQVEVEVETFDELEQALDAQADIIMLDNFTIEAMRQAVEHTGQRAKLEASGNIDLTNLAQVAETGVDFISIGALTKHVQAIDLSMRLVQNG